VSLSPLDDFPVHQIAEPIRRVGTSDRNFYDRYYFNLHSIDADACLIAGFGTYPNLGVVDGFAVLVHGGRHTVVRASRELGLDRLDTSVGPLRVEVIEGLRRLRLVLDPNEWGLTFDLEFVGSIAAQEEPRHFLRENERVLYDTFRLAQTGTWRGTIEVDGKRLDVEPARWWGCRDRSWGVRAIGEPEPAGIRANRPPSMLWTYAQFQFEDHSFIFMCHERLDGPRVLEEGIRVWNDPERPVDRLGSPKHDLEFEPGTRTVTGGTLTFGTGADSIVVSFAPLLPVYLGIGTGYSSEPDWRNGMYQGPLKVEGMSVDLSDPATHARKKGLVDTVARFEYDGKVGYGLWEYVFVGPYPQYGFTSWTDGYTPSAD